MKQYIWLAVGLGSFLFGSLETEKVHVAVHDLSAEKLSVGVLWVGAMNQDVTTVTQRYIKDIQYSGQCTVSFASVDALKHVSDLKNAFASDMHMIICLSYEQGAYVWRLYDSITHAMITGDKVVDADLSLIMIAHTMADQVWPALMGSHSSFRSKIAYCKRIWKKKKHIEKPYSEVWITDFDGTNAQKFLDAHTVIVAPRWNPLKECPSLFYSENTVSNVQLVMSNMFKKRKVMCCFDGLNMQPTFSPNGKELVFCLSKDGTSQLYHAYVNSLGAKTYDRLTQNAGNNIAPCFIDDRTIIFVSDYMTKKPQLYRMNIQKPDELEQITDGSYCACPCYCAALNKLVYIKKIDAWMQLMEYDLKTGQHTQLTQGKGNKEEPSWSQCGTYIVYCVNDGETSRIMQLNTITHSNKTLTAAQEYITYPNYSPVYNLIIGVLKQ